MATPIDDPLPDPAEPDLLGALGANLGLLDELYGRFQADPTSVDPGFRALFRAGDEGTVAAGMANGTAQHSRLGTAAQHSRLGTAAPAGSLGAAPGATTAPVAPLPASPLPSVLAMAPLPDDDAALSYRAHALTHAYRVRGHLEADLDPLHLAPRGPHPDLDPATYWLGETDMDRVVSSGLFGGPFGGQRAPLRQIVARLRSIYADKIGVQFMHISDPIKRNWLAERMETLPNQFASDRQAQLHIYEKLVAAEVLERFIHTKYVGTKRFSLEGGESLIPLLDTVLEQAGRYQIEEAVIGMAHRGRLNVLANLIGKSPSLIFAEFEDIDPESVLGGGDVKYHMGYSSDHLTRAGDRIHLSLAFNPSHLEAVDPVAVGRVRAKQRRRNDAAHEKVLGVLVHGDAAFAGQGLVAETLNLSNLHGYRTGGTIHVIVNNQIGFTTSPSASRSTEYCTDVAKMIEVPIFHVNGEAPEAVAHVVQVAMEYRRQFGCDVVIDMFCFRRYGHNEGDEPNFTQPLLYQKIDKHPSVRVSYGQSLIERGVLSAAEAEAVIGRRQEALERELQEARQKVERPPVQAMKGYWSGYQGGLERDVAEADTAVPRERLAEIGRRISQVPAGFSPHPKIARLLQTRGAMARGEAPLDWGMGEALAFGSLLYDGTLVRCTGQDTRRGTFSHRHAVIVDIKTGAEHAPLRHLRDPGDDGDPVPQGHFLIYDSMLSEAACLGFEYGYSLDYPDGLVIWEAQFGDFVNGAQVIIDQFVSSAEDKWARLSGLTLLLPHGFEGQGPEHSSARFERFLQLCAEDNMTVAYPTTPAQFFHLLRRQVLRPWRKPLIVLSPKSLLRHPGATSSLDELAGGRFSAVLPDPMFGPTMGPTSAAARREGVQRIILCTGKVYYDLLDERQRRGDEKTALLRLEQLYPFREAEVAAALRLYGNATELCWVQEEPANMGALGFLLSRLPPLAGRMRFRVVSRAESASPATGSHKAHIIEQKALIEEALSGLVRRLGEGSRPQRKDAKDGPGGAPDKTTLLQRLSTKPV